ncbi:MAG: ATP-binding cassette domain-containing protein [Haloferacaceae archaeon]
MNAIELTNVTKRFGDVTALDGVSLSVPDGEVFGLLGTNGAGKTTLFRILVDHLRPDAGSVTVAGAPANDGPSVRDRVGYLPQRVGFPPAFTGRETLRFHARMRGVPARERDTRIGAALDTVGLTAAADRKSGGYSQGMIRRLGLASVLVARPSVLLLDEPTSGLDPEGVEAFHDVIARYNEDAGATVVYTSHTLAEVEEVCERVAILDDGRVLVSGPVDDLRRHAGDEVTVVVYADGAALASAADRLDDDPAVRSARRDGGRLVVACERAAAYDVVTRIRSRVDLDGFEVREPHLADVFHRALAGAGNADGGATADD